MNKIFKITALLLFVVTMSSLQSCKKYFGENTDLSFIDTPDFQQRQIAYVPIQPAIVGLVNPTDVKAGFDELIYVVDAGTEQIISYDQSGRELARLFVPGVTKIAQDRKLNLLAVGTIDTTVAGTPYKLACIYRIQQYNNGLYGLQYAKITQKIVHPFYFKSTFSSNDATVKLNGIAINADNSFYVTRSGNSQSLTQIGGPDDAVLVFDKNGQFVSTISVNTSSGFFRDYFKKPFGITTLCQPPQITASNSKDFIFTSTDPNVPFKVQYIEYVESEFGAQYNPRPLAFKDTTVADGAITDPGKFINPSGVTVTGDGTNYIFVTDSEKDSLYQFTITGFEGIRPPPGSVSNKYVKASFGGTGINLSQFEEPGAVAYLGRYVFVADTKNRRILRFRLTIDFN